MPRVPFALALALAFLTACVDDGAFEFVRGRVDVCAPWPESDDLDAAGCDEASAEVWRCALSAGAWTDAEGEPVAISQVCRRTGDGWAWRTYTLFPADCGTCEGRDPAIPDGCEPSSVDRGLYELPECAPGEEDAEPADPWGAVGDDDPWGGGDADADADADGDGDADAEGWPLGGGDADADADTDADAEGGADDPGAVSPGVVGPEGVAAWDALPAGDRAALAARRLFWGHQSVGDNLVEGSGALGYDWSEVASGSDYDAVTWGHGYIADNGDPYRKIRSFEAFLDDGGIGARVDAAAFKFCWIDFEPDTDVAALLAEAQATLADLAARFPGVRFLHVTPPLTTDDTERNAVRWNYGRRLIAAESADAVVLDLAAIESTDAAGHACALGGVPRLCPEWASDEGHLNAAGRAHAARAFLYAFSRLF